MSDHSLTSTVWKWVVQDESKRLIALPASAASIKHPGNCSPYVQSSRSHEPEFSVQFISQPFWSTPCLLRTTNPIRTEHPGSWADPGSDFCNSGFLKLNRKYWFIFCSFFSFMFFSFSAQRRRIFHFLIHRPVFVCVYVGFFLSQLGWHRLCSLSSLWLSWKRRGWGRDDSRREARRQASSYFALW